MNASYLMQTKTIQQWISTLWFGSRHWHVHGRAIIHTFWCFSFFHAETVPHGLTVKLANGLFTGYQLNSKWSLWRPHFANFEHFGYPACMTSSLFNSNRVFRAVERSLILVCKFSNPNFISVAKSWTILFRIIEHLANTPDQFNCEPTDWRTDDDDPFLVCLASRRT